MMLITRQLQKDHEPFSNFPTNLKISRLGFGLEIVKDQQIQNLIT